MTLDNAAIAVLCEELNRELAGGRIDKIQQPARDLVLLTVRMPGVNRRLLLSGSPGKARMHLTAMQLDNPPEPSLFCILLRKHLSGAVIREFSQPGEDRLLIMSADASDDLGRTENNRLIVEMIPGKTNIILVGGDGLIIDCAYRRDYDADGYRRLSPGMIYRLPKLPEHKDSADRRKDAAPAAADGLFSDVLDRYYTAREKEEVYRRRSRELRTALNSAEKRIRRKLAVQREDLARSMGREEIRRKADLVTANIWRMKRGDSILKCEDFYAPGNPAAEIAIDPLLTPQANAAKLYKQYNKLKTAELYLTRLIGEGEAQLDYISSVQDELTHAASERDIREIRQELIQAGVLKNKSAGSARKETKQPPYSAVSADGFEILAGRNNLQNEELTFRTAHRDDFWFHVKASHGSHVILRCGKETPSEDAVMLAAAMAVWYSQSRNSGNVAVDYTRVRHVKKMPGALPGRVNYTEYQTVIVKDCRIFLSKTDLHLSDL